MLEQHIQQKREKGFIASVAVIFRSGKWIIECFEDENDEKGRPIRYFLTLQRIDDNNKEQVRKFAKLESAANVLRKLGFSYFTVNL